MDPREKYRIEIEWTLMTNIELKQNGLSGKILN